MASFGKGVKVLYDRRIDVPRHEGSFVPPAAVQGLRDLTRTRKQLVWEVAQHTHRIRCICDQSRRIKKLDERAKLRAKADTS